MTEESNANPPQSAPQAAPATPSTEVGAAPQLVQIAKAGLACFVCRDALEVGQKGYYWNESAEVGRVAHELCFWRWKANSIEAFVQALQVTTNSHMRTIAALVARAGGLVHLRKQDFERADAAGCEVDGEEKAGVFRLELKGQRVHLAAGPLLPTGARSPTPKKG
jgi:hypothetical protein